MVVVNRDDPDEAYLLALDGATGKTVWKQACANANRSSGTANTSTPTIWNGQIVVHRADEVVAYEPKKGEKLWWVKVRSTGIATPIDGAGTLYVSTWNNFGEPELRVTPAPWSEFLKTHDKNGDGANGVDEFPAMFPLARRPEASVKGVDLTLPGKSVFGGMDGNKDGKIDETEWAKVLENFNARQDHGLLAIKSCAQG